MHKLLVMGVAGCGKSTLAAALALALGCETLEGDDYHPPASQQKMRRGVALDDGDRVPWLDRIGVAMATQGGCVVGTCSALKRRYRERLRARIPGLKFVFVEISQADAESRVAERTDHLFPPSLVANQFAALESPVGEDGVLVLPATAQPQEQLGAVLRWLAAAAGAASGQNGNAPMESM